MNDDRDPCPVPAETPRAIAEYLENIARWRERKAEEYDRDARNLRTATALRQLATHIQSLPLTDSRLVELHRLAFEGDLFAPGQMTAYEIGRFRFHHPEATLDPFLDQLVELAQADHTERGHFGGKLPPGDDPWG